MSDKAYGREESDDRDSARRLENMGMSSKKDRDDTPRIESLLSTMVDVTDCLEQSLDRLRAKLGPVTGPLRPELAEKSLGDDREEMSDVANAIDSEISRLQHLRDSVDSLTGRVEC